MCCLMKDEGGRMDVVSTSLHNKSLRQAPVPIRGSDDQPILKNTPSSQHDFEIRLIWRTTTTSSKSLLLPLNFSVPKSFNYITKHLHKLRWESKVAFPPSTSATKSQVFSSDLKTKFTSHPSSHILLIRTSGGRSMAT